MGKRILIVDDDELVLIALQELLKSRHFEVVTVSRGVEALKKLDEEGFDLMILDIVMPEMDGFELCAKIREKPNGRKTPIIFLSAKNREEDQRRGLEVGADLFLSKPISPQKLLDLIAEVMGQDRG
jgi:DNA-binding response OmpR family regulator